MFVSQLFEFESDGKTAVITFGRLNPPTIGHQKLIDTVLAIPGDHYVYVSHTQDNKKNPLPVEDKISYLNKIYPGKNVFHAASKENPTIITAATALYKQGYTNLVVVVGADRVAAFEKLFNDYNGVFKDGNGYKFNSIKFVSAGERDPDADDVTGMSASKMRELAVAGDIEGFKQGLDPKLHQYAQGMMQKIASVLGTAKPKKVKEDDEEDNVFQNVVKTGRDSATVKAMMQRSHARALQMHKGDEKSPGFAAAKYSHLARQAMGPKGKEHLVADINESAYDTKKPYGIKYKVFAGKEQRIATKEVWYATAAQMEKAAEKIQNLGNFYEIDGYAFPQEHQVEESQFDLVTTEDSEPNVPNTDEILYSLTSAYRAIINGDYFSPEGKETLTMVYDMLREPLKNEDIGQFNKYYDYVMAKYPDVADELIDTMFQKAGLGDQGTHDQFMAKVSENEVEEGRVPQLPTNGADYSKYDTEHLKAMLQPGMMHRNELKFKTLMRRELRKREAANAKPVAEGGFPHDVDHMNGPRVPFAQTKPKHCSHCNGNGKVYTGATKFRWIHPGGDAKLTSCPSCNGSGTAKDVEEGAEADNQAWVRNNLHRLNPRESMKQFTDGAEIDIKGTPVTISRQPGIVGYTWQSNDGKGHYEEINTHSRENQDPARVKQTMAAEIQYSNTRHERALSAVANQAAYRRETNPHHADMSGVEEGIGDNSIDPKASALGKFAYYAITAKGKNEPRNPYPAGTKSNADFDQGYEAAWDQQTRSHLAAPVEELVRLYNVADRLPLLKRGKGVAQEGIGDTIKRGVKSVKRGMQGWGGAHGKPDEIVKRNKGHDDQTIKNLDLKGKIYKDVDGPAPAHSPQALQNRVVDREMKKRGLEESPEQMIGPLAVQLCQFMQPARRDQAFGLIDSIREKYGNEYAIQIWKRAKAMRSSRPAKTSDTNPFVDIDEAMGQEQDDTQNPDPKIRQLAMSVEKMKSELAQLEGNVEESAPLSNYNQRILDKALASHAKAKADPNQQKNPLSHDKNGVYVGDKDLAGREVPKQVTELSPATHSRYISAANKSRQDATDDMMNNNVFDPKVVDKMDRRADQTIKSIRKINPQSRGEPVTELSNDALAGYKTAAGKDASKADKEGNFKRGDKRFSGIVKATNKQFANDAKSPVPNAKVIESEMHVFARKGNLEAVAECVEKLVPMLSTSKHLESSIDRAIRTVRRNSKP